MIQLPATVLIATCVLVLCFVILAMLPKMRRRFSVHEASVSAVFITGTSSGIGKELALRLIRRGYLVFGTVRKQSDADSLLRALPTGFAPILCDVASEEQVASAVNSVQSHLDSLNKDRHNNFKIKLVAVINNAGIFPRDDGFDSKRFKNIFEVNVFGLYRVTEAFAPMLLESKGRIVNIGSYFGSFTMGWGAEYAASKHAIEGLTDGFRRLLANRQVSVSLIKPGNIISDMNPRGESSASVVEDAVLDALTSPQPRERYYPGTIMGYPCWFLCHLFAILPEPIADRLL